MKRVTLRGLTFISIGIGALILGLPGGSQRLPGRSGARAGGDQDMPTYQIGDPLPGLSANHMSLFAIGKERFAHHFTPAEGLGPIFNEDGCVVCHGNVATGGGDPVGPGSVFNVTHFSYDNQGFFDPLRDLGGPLMEKRSIGQSLVPGCPMPPTTVPPIANVLSIRNTPPVFGFGLLDAIPDAEILANQNLNIDGIRGVANWGTELQAMDQEPVPRVPLNDWGLPRVGRFGWKSQTATLQQFSAEPLNAELGVTNPFFPQEHTPSGVTFAKELPPGCNVADQPGPNNPDLKATNDPGQRQSIALYHFQALLAPPPPLPRDEAARRGEARFSAIGCANCHRPEMVTGPVYNLLLADGTTQRVPQIEDQLVHAYSDLLLHEMGNGLADDGGTNVGRIQGRADGHYWRTTPLWGLRFKKTLLHDGRTTDPREAILQHGGEAQIVRDRFAGLSPDSQNDIIAFLKTL